ncbi:MAG: hypothetical protein AAF685_07220 [Cyanobacteria bacterium P01_C01_bin.89]
MEAQSRELKVTLLENILGASSAPNVWAALGRWVESWQATLAGGEIEAAQGMLSQDCQRLVGHLGTLDWQGVPGDRLSKSRSLTVEMHRQLMLLRTDLRFLSVTRQDQKRSQLMNQMGDRFKHIGGYCQMAQQYLNGDLEE